MKGMRVLFIGMISFFFLAGSSLAAEKVYKWKMVSTWNRGQVFITEVKNRFVESVKKMSNGQLLIDVYPAGELGTGPDTLDKVSSGVAEIGEEWPGYWAGKNPVFDLLGTQTMTFSAEDYGIWVWAKGGLDFYQEIYGRYNCVYLPHYVHHMESGIRSNKPINKLSDLKGMKIRIAGLLPGRMAKELGAVQVLISPNDFYEAMRRGTIDGFEYSTPSGDLDLKVDEIAKCWVIPGWHQTGSQHGLAINKKAWDSLPDHLKEVLRSAAMASYLWSFCRSSVRDAEATTYFQKNIKITELSAEDMATLEKLKNKIQEELATQYPDYGRVLKSQLDYMKMMAPYRDAIKMWGFGRNLAAYPNIR